MRKVIAASTVLLFVSLLASPVLAGGDCCKAAVKDGQGWCDKCKHGEVLGFHLASKKVYDSLAGTPIKDSGMEKSACCAKAIKDSGACAGCKVSFANGKMYHSNYAHDIALGTPITDAKVAEALGKCEGCKSASKSPQGAWCEACKGGVVAGRWYTSKDSFTAAQNAAKVVNNAITAAKQCEECGAAMVTDGTCTHCKLTFKNGEKVKS